MKHSRVLLPLEVFTQHSLSFSNHLELSGKHQEKNTTDQTRKISNCCFNFHYDKNKYNVLKQEPGLIWYRIMALCRLRMTK